MKIEEAIEQLKINTGKEPLTISGSATRMADYFKALSIASEALEKQVPKKVIYENYNYICPICGGIVEDEDKCRFDYCPDCGNKIDWSEADD